MMPTKKQNKSTSRYFIPDENGKLQPVPESVFLEWLIKKNDK